MQCSVADLLRAMDDQGGVPASVERMAVLGRLHIISSADDELAQGKRHSRGTILLVDLLDGRQNVVCQVDKVLPRMHNEPVVIDKWVLVSLPAPYAVRYLEFSIDSVHGLYDKALVTKREKEHTRTLVSTPYLYQPRYTQATQPYFVTPSQLVREFSQYARHSKPVAFVGRIETKSILYATPHSEACFTLEVCDTSQPCSWSVPIFFKGNACIKYYASFTVWEIYAFVSLESGHLGWKTRVNPDQTDVIKRPVLKYVDMQSFFFPLYKRDQLTRLLGPAASPPLSNGEDGTTTDASTLSLESARDHDTDDNTTGLGIPLPPPSTSLIGSSTTGSPLQLTTGVVTRVLDATLGIFELDYQWILCLFHYLDYSEKRPYRVGTRLLVSNVHVMYIDTADKYGVASYLLDSEWGRSSLMDAYYDNATEMSEDSAAQEQPSLGEKKPKRRPCVVMIACMRSNVRVRAFASPEDRRRRAGQVLRQPEDVFGHQIHDDGFKSKVYSSCMMRRLHFPALIRHLELYASLRRKFGHLLSNSDESDTSSSEESSLSPPISTKTTKNTQILSELWNRVVSLVFATTGSRQMHQEGHLLHNLFQHDQACIAIHGSAKGQAHVPLDVFPTLSDLLAWMEQDQENNGNDSTTHWTHRVPTRLSPALMASCVRPDCYYFDAQHRDKAWVVGRTVYLGNGQLYLYDDTTRVPLVVVRNEQNDHLSSPCIQPGAFYLIMRFQWVVEDISYNTLPSFIDQDAEKISLVTKYIICNAKDMKKIDVPDAEAMEPWYISPIFSTLPTAFSLASEKDNDGDVAMTVLEKLPPRLFKVLDVMAIERVMVHGKIHLQRVVRTLQFPVFEGDKDVLCPVPFETTLIFTTVHHSLAMAGGIERDAWIGIDNMGDCIAQLPDAGQVPTIYIRHCAPNGENNENNENGENDENAAEFHTIHPVHLVAANVRLPSPSAKLFKPLRDTDPLVVHARYATDDLRQRGTSMETHHTRLIDTYKRYEHQWDVMDINQVYSAAHEQLEKEKQAQEEAERAKQQQNANQPEKKFRIKSKVNIGLINVRAMVLAKAFVEDSDKRQRGWLQNRSHGTQNDPAVRLFRDARIGNGGATRRLFLQLGQVDGLRTIDVYFNHNIHLYDLGIVPGNTITLFKVELRRSLKSHRLYASAGCQTVMKVDALLDQHEAAAWESRWTKDLAVRSLGTLLAGGKAAELVAQNAGGHVIDANDASVDSDATMDEDESDRATHAMVPMMDDTDLAQEEHTALLFKSVVQLRSISSMLLQWLCLSCGGVVENGRCHGQCQDAKYLFRAEARATMYDGTAEIHAMVDTDHLVFALLMLLPKQQESLKQAAWHNGTITAGKYKNQAFNHHRRDTTFIKRPTTTDAETATTSINDTDNDVATFRLRNGMDLQDLCTRAERHAHFYLHGERFHEKADSNPDDILDELGLRMVRVFDRGKENWVVALPFTRVKVLNLTPVDEANYAWSLINELDE